MDRFDLLAPNVVISAIEGFLDVELDGTLTVYPSYINRVYGVRATDGSDYVAKFYRPGRWSEPAIAQEHEFCVECSLAEVPVVPPIESDGSTVGGIIAESAESEQEFLFAVYPKRGGRNFDAESDEDWIRMGSVAGRLHSVAVAAAAPDRLTCTPEGSTFGFLEDLGADDVIHPDVRDDYVGTAESALRWITPLFEGTSLHRIHGDFHRGNILDRPGQGLLVVDFDDMMTGPAVQDLWLLLPDRAHAVRRELNLIIEGYEQFADFEHETLRLIEPLRLMRMIYYIAWSASQRSDKRFQESFPHWGGKAFWEKELEDLNTQIGVIRDDLESEEES